MRKKSTAQPLKREEATKIAPKPLDVKVDMTAQTMTLTYGEISAAYNALGFMGTRLNPNSFDLNTKIRVCRRALKDHVEDLSDMIQKLSAHMALKRDEEGEIVRGEDGNFAVKQPDYDIERRVYLRKTVDVTCPVWHPAELTWMQEVTIDDLVDGFVFQVLEDLGPLYQE